MDGAGTTRSTTPNLSHRKSLQLSQFFSRSRRSSVADPPSSPTSMVYPSSVESSVPSRPASSLGDYTSMPVEDDLSHPTLSSKKSFRHRISILDIPRLFSPTSPTVSSPSLSSFSSKDSKDSDPILTPRSNSESLPSPPQLPELTGLSDRLSNGPQQRPHSFHATETRFSTSSSAPKLPRDTMSARPQPEVIAESSFEMRLDSLHFDSLHFDPDEF